MFSTICIIQLTSFLLPDYEDKGLLARDNSRAWSDCPFIFPFCPHYGIALSPRTTISYMLHLRKRPREI